MLDSHRILFQEPTGVSEKVYIPPAFVVLFHNSNALVKAFILLFIQINWYHSLLRRYVGWSDGWSDGWSVDFAACQHLGYLMPKSVSFWALLL